MKTLERYITITVQVFSRSENSTAETISRVQDLVDDLSFDDKVRADIEIKITKEKL